MNAVPRRCRRPLGEYVVAQRPANPPPMITFLPCPSHHARPDSGDPSYGIGFFLKHLCSSLIVANRCRGPGEAARALIARGLEKTQPWRRRFVRWPRPRFLPPGGRPAGARVIPRGWLREMQKSYASPAYAELQLAGVPAQIAILRIFGDFAIKDPILITAQGIIIDGYTGRLK